MSTAQPSKNPGVKGTSQPVQQTAHKDNSYANRGTSAANHKPRGMGC